MGSKIAQNCVTSFIDNPPISFTKRLSPEISRCHFLVLCKVKINLTKRKVKEEVCEAKRLKSIFLIKKVVLKSESSQFVTDHLSHYPICVWEAPRNAESSADKVSSSFSNIKKMLKTSAAAIWELWRKQLHLYVNLRVCYSLFWLPVRGLWVHN